MPRDISANGAGSVSRQLAVNERARDFSDLILDRSSARQLSRTLPQGLTSWDSFFFAPHPPVISNPFRRDNLNSQLSKEKSLASEYECLLRATLRT